MFVLVGVNVFVIVGVGVNVFVAVGVNVFVGVRVAVFVAVGVAPVQESLWLFVVPMSKSPPITKNALFRTDPVVLYLACKALGRLVQRFVTGSHWIAVLTMLLPDAPGPTTHLPLNNPDAAPQCGLKVDGKSAIAASLQVSVAGSYLAVVSVSVPNGVKPPPT